MENMGKNSNRRSVEFIHPLMDQHPLRRPEGQGMVTLGLLYTGLRGNMITFVGLYLEFLNESQWVFMGRTGSP